jgi:hypothetical protein
MVDEARSDLQAGAYPQTSEALEPAIARRAARGVVAALGVLALLLVVFRATPLDRLPDYPAVVLAFLLSVAVPGYFVQRALLNGAHPLAKLAAMPGLGLALIALPGFFALEVHTSLDRFEVMYAVFAAIACGVSVLFWREDHDAAESQTRDTISPLVLVMLLIVLGGIVTTPFWAKNRVSGDFDDWTYMAYARDYVGADHMNQHEPFFGTDDAPTPRMRDNVWVLTQALVSDTSGMPPNEVLLEYMRPMLTVLVLLATFALTWTLFKHTTIALLAMAFQVGYALIDLSPHEGMGRNLFVRISEDKMIGAFMLFPIGLVFVARFIEKRSPASVVGFTLIVLAISLVHPVPLAFLAITIGAFAALRLLQDRDVRSAAMLALLLVPVGAGSIWPLVQRQLLHGTAPQLFGTEESAITFRDAFRFTKLGHGLLIGNYHMIVNPVVIAAIMLAPLAWLLARRRLGNEMLAAMTGGALIVFFVPLIATPLAKVMTPQTLWKVPWMIPVGPILAYLTFEGTRRLASFGAIAAGRLRGFMTMAVVPAAALVLVLVVAVLVQEQYIRADGGTYYDGTRGGSFLPGPNESIFLGGIDRGLSGTWRLDPYLKNVVDFMGRNIPPGSVVLVEPNQLNHMIPGLLPDVYPVDFGGAAGAGERRADVTLFTRGQLDQNELGGVIDRWGVDYIAVHETASANRPLVTYYRVQLDQGVGPYELYKVVK